MSAFAQSMREAPFTRINKDELVEGTFSPNLSHVAQALRSNNRPDPRLETEVKKCFILQEQFRIYHDKDVTKLMQKALPMMVLRKMLELAVSEREKYIDWLRIVDLFFAMRYCEYLKVAPEETKRTKIIRVGNVVFKKGNIVIQHNDPDLISSDLVRIIFFQNSDKSNICIHIFLSHEIQFYAHLFHGKQQSK